MSNDNKTLADVRPGGRVRLGDQAERARFEQYRGGDFERDAQGYYTNPRTAQDWAMWQAALSAQPSPGGQGGLNYERMFVDACVALAEVSRELGCDPEQGGAEPILAAIAELRAAQPSPGGQDALETARELLAAEFEKNDVTAAAARRLRNHNQTAVEAAALRVIAARQPSKQPDSVALGEATEFCIEKGARQPVGEPVAFQLAGSEPLWCLHVLGMDDVHPAPSKAHAEKAAAWHNEQFKDQAERLGISIEAKVVPWPHSAESHAAGAAEFIPQWLIPQWQLDALEANAKQPAQAVDLGQFRPAVELMEWQERGHAHPDFPEGNPEKHADALRLLALIDSQAVGNG